MAEKTYRSDTGVLLKRIPGHLNPDHPYKYYPADPLTGGLYYGTDARGYRKIKNPEKPCPPIVWEQQEGPPPPRNKRTPVLVISIFQEGNRISLEMRPAA